MKKSFGLVIVAVSVLNIGCASTYMAHQFIDVDETLRFFPKMAKRDVKEVIGVPTEARAGVVLSSGEVYEIWLYRVREKLQKVPLPERKPAKNFSGGMWGKETEYMVVFKNDQVVKWGHYGDDWKDFAKEDGDILAPMDEKANNQPKGSLDIFGGKKK